MSEEVLQDIIIATSSKEVWDSLQMKFASSTKARTVQIRVKLMTSKKRDISAADFFHKITGLANKLTAANAPLRDEEVLAYLLASLLVEYEESSQSCLPLMVLSHKTVIWRRPYE
jgi:hypothetical protein